MTDEPNWHWWYSDNEERYSGPCSSREEAIEMGRDEYHGEQFIICEAFTSSYRLRVDYYSLMDLFDHHNQDLDDPDGDSTMNTIATGVQQRALIDAVNIAIDHWIVEHGINMRAFMFQGMRNEETITA